MDPRGLENQLARLAAERKRLEQLRSDYERITRSRFHALRMLWFSLKSLIRGGDSPDDRYAVWSRGITEGTGVSLYVALSSEYALEAQEQHLIERWTRKAWPGAALEPPAVTIVIPLHDHRDLTLRCLQSIVDAWPTSLRMQVVVVDDGSTDELAQLVARMPGLDYVRNSKNEGFIRACTLGAALARGKYMLFLNNDTTLNTGAIEYLVRTAEADATIGVVGAKLIFPDGRLQEAGAILWRDASGWQYGEYEDPNDPRYNYVRDVDYVSGAALLVRKALFAELGGFDRTLQRAYYEDTDLCFGARKLGYRVVYQPLSEVTHIEGASSADTSVSAMKRYQEINRPIFRAKWAAELQEHYDNSPDNVPAGARRLRQRPTILVVDFHVPLYDRDSGSNRLMQIIRVLLGLGHHIIFLPDNYSGLQPYTEELQQLGVEVLYQSENGRSMEAALDEVIPFVDCAWISRPEMYRKYAPLIKRNPKIRFIYDTVDLYFLRKKREAELQGGDEAEWQSWQQMELEAARGANATVVVTNDEKAVLEELGVRGVHVISNIHSMEAKEPRSPRDTAGLLFIGNYNHLPNVDGCAWLVNEVMPTIWKSLPNVVLTLLGANPPESIFELESERVRITGYAADVAPYFARNRVFVAPLRYGAGLKGKIGQALAYRLPVVTTPIGAEGFGFNNGEHFLVAPAEPQAFADAVLALYNDAALWKRLSDASEEALRDLTPDAVAPRLRDMLRAAGG